MFKLLFATLAIVFVILFATGNGWSDLAQSKVAQESIELIQTGTVAVHEAVTTATTQADVDAAFAE